jgi:hypothetical protein
MSDLIHIMPPHVREAERIAAAWRKSIEQPLAPRRDMQRDWAAALDRCRQHDQSKMPAWQDPRKPR